MATKISTHALDIHQGRPAQGLRIRLYRLEGNSAPQLIRDVFTNPDGRTDAPLFETDGTAGRYELLFEIGAYFAAQKIAVAAPPFLDEVPIRFAVAAGSSYHVPLLFSPWAYSTYRGS